MVINERKIDDFKTERKDLLPPLPMIFRLVPLLFYLAILFALVVGSVAVWHSRAAAEQRRSVIGQTAALQAEIQNTKAARDSLDGKTLEAMDLESWVLGSMPLQPLMVEIARSISADASIMDLRIERDAETPSQLKLAITLRTASEKQLDKTLAAVKALNYRVLSPTQTMKEGDLEYRATLAQEAGGRLPLPQDRMKETRQP